MIKKAENLNQCVALCRTMLSGKICFTSRRKEWEENTLLDPEAEVAFGTLHCIADKILKGTQSNAYLDMWKTVEKAIEKEFELPEKKEERDPLVRGFYHLIRNIENNTPYPHFNHPDMQVLFQKVVANYNDLRGREKKDWEDSLLAATYALQSGIEYRINTENLVLLNIEYLQEQANANALNFFLTLFRHQSVRGCNCYFMDKNLKLYVYSAKEDMFYPLKGTDPLYSIGFYVG